VEKNFILANVIAKRERHDIKVHIHFFTISIPPDIHAF